MNQHTIEIIMEYFHRISKVYTTCFAQDFEISARYGQIKEESFYLFLLLNGQILMTPSSEIFVTPQLYVFIEWSFIWKKFFDLFMSKCYKARFEYFVRKIENFKYLYKRPWLYKPVDRVYWNEIIKSNQHVLLDRR